MNISYGMPVQEEQPFPARLAQAVGIEMPSQRQPAPQADPMSANAAYAQYLVDTMGEQAAFQKLQSERIQLPRGWVPDFERGMKIGNQRRLQQVLDETRRSHQENERIRLLQAQRERYAPKWKQIEDAEGNLFLVDETGRHQTRPVLLPGGEGGPRQAVKYKDLGANELESVRENAQQLAQVIKALGMMRGETVEGQAGDPEATGWKGLLPNIILQRIDPEGNPTRAQVGNVGSLRIKQRSGGAVPAAEMARLKPFIPNETDTADTARQKLGLFATEYAKMLEEDVSAFKASNRRVPKALESYVGERVKAARGVVSGRPAGAALSGAPDPQELLQAIQAELARRRGGQ